MQNIFFGILLLLLALPGSHNVLSSTSHGYTHQSSPDSIVFHNSGDDHAAADRIMAQGIHRFSIKLEMALREQLGIRRNLVFSPLSVASVLALVLLGADGRTHEELSSVLGLKGLGLEGPQADKVHEHFGRLLDLFLLSNASSSLSPGVGLVGKAVFLQRDLILQPQFRELSRRAYHSDVYHLDFANSADHALQFINRWVSSRTRGKISEMLSDQPSPYTQLILASALYFKGNWLYPFPLQNTAPHLFTVSRDESVKIPMMVLTEDLPYAKSSQLGCSLLALPYNFTNFLEQVSMYIVLPDSPGVEGVIELTERLNLNPDTLDYLINSAILRPVIAVIPRMKLDTSLALVPPLSRLGARSLFNPHTADLSKLVQGTSGLYVDDVRHRVTMDITETGTEASAATTAAISRDGSAKLFKANRPFIFLLRHHATNMPLFWGSVLSPPSS